MRLVAERTIMVELGLTTRQLQLVGAALFAVGTLLLVGLLPGVGLVPTVAGASVAVLALALGTLLISLSRSEDRVV